MIIRFYLRKMYKKFKKFTPSHADEVNFPHFTGFHFEILARTPKQQLSDLRSRTVASDTDSETAGCLTGHRVYSVFSELIFFKR